MTRLAALAALLPLLTMLGLGTLERSFAPPRGSVPIGPIYGEHVVSQTFTPTGPVISAIDVRLATYARRNDGVVTLRLRRLGSDEDLRTASVPASEIRDSALHRFRFDPLVIEGIQRGGWVMGKPLAFEFRIENTAPNVENAIAVWGTDQRLAMLFLTADFGDESGLAAYDGVVQSKDLVFAPVYQEPALPAIGASVSRIGATGPASVIGLLALLLPGLLLARICMGPRRSPVAVLAAAPAFGIAIIALATLWRGILGLGPGPLVPAGVTAGSLFALGGLELARRRDPRRSEFGAASRAEWRAAAAALGAVALGLASRAIALEGLATPPGADSYHHALITQLILEQGGVPSSYAPYAPIDSFAYHFGFHATAAWMASLSGRDGLQAVELAGPLLNGLAAVSIFGLVLLAGLGPVAAAVAAIVTALVSPFPMWFLDVGRYPQEAALLVLPLAAAFALGFADQRTSKIMTVSTANGSRDSAAPSAHVPADALRTVAGGALLAAGLFVSHYRIALMLLVLIGLRLVWMMLAGRRRGFSTVRWELTRSTGVLIGAAVLVAPWIVRLAQAFTLGIRGSEGRYAPDYYSLERLGTALSQPIVAPLMIVAILGLAVALARRVPLVGVLALWGAVVFVGSNPRWLPLPGAGALDSVTVISSLYVAGAVAIGYFAQWLWDARGEHPPPAPPSPATGEGGAGLPGARPAQWELAHPSLQAPYPFTASARSGPIAAWRMTPAEAALRFVALAGISWLAGWGALHLPRLVQPEQALAAAGDLRAARWIESSLPAHARFLVNASVVSWEPDFVEPTDGGAWLPLLAHRSTTLLPLVYAGERGAAPADIDRMERIARAARADVAAPATIALLREAGVTHVYLGAYGGPIDEARLAESPAFRRVYGADGVSIYELLSSTDD